MEKEFIKYLDYNGNDRLRIKFLTDKGKVLDVVVQYESKVNDKWHPVVRYDCSHGFFHRDILTLTGDKKSKLF
jgi:hypothetical protein